MKTAKIPERLARQAYAAGQAAYATGQRAPTADPTVRELLAELPPEVGSGATELFAAFARGFDEAADAAAERAAELKLFREGRL